MSTYPTSERPPYIEQLRAESRGLQYRPAKRRNSERSRPSPEDSRRLFTVEKGNRWLELARREPEAKMLLGELWHQGELCMMFADTNIGKSVMAVQIGESIARGQSIAPFACQAEPASVLYIDFELSKTQFGLRYSKGEEDYQFSDNFHRAQYNFLPDAPPNVDENELLIAGIEYKINQVKATVLIIDNITCLRGGTENSAVALSLMKSLKALKTDYQLSILVLAHTPKRRNPTQPISADDLHGSKLLVNFADSAFAIGKSTAGSDVCYLKQIKQRNTRQRYGEDNVCLCRMQKPGTFLHFAFEGNSAERHHLLSRTAVTHLHLAGEIAALSADGFSQREISSRLGIGLATVNKLLRQGERCVDEERCVDMQMRGCADGEECANMRMRGCADEEQCADAPMTNDQPTNDQKGREGFSETKSPYYPGFPDKFSPAPAPPPMTTDVMTNDENPPITNDVMTNDQNPPMTNDVMTNDENPPITNDVMTNDQNPPMTNDVMTNGQNPADDIERAKLRANLPLTWGLTTSAIDMLLTPKLLKQILAGGEKLTEKDALPKSIIRNTPK